MDKSGAEQTPPLSALVNKVWIEDPFSHEIVIVKSQQGCACSNQQYNQREIHVVKIKLPQVLQISTVKHLYPFIYGYSFFCTSFLPSDFTMRRLSGYVFGHSWPLIRKIPVLRFLIFFAAGIFIADWLNRPPDKIVCAAFLILQLICWLILHFYLKSSFRHRHHFGVAITAMFFLQGFFLTSLRIEVFHPNHFSRWEEVELYQGVIDGTLREREKSYRAPVVVNAVRYKGEWYKCSGKLMCYFSKRNNALPAFGSTVLFETTPRKLLKEESPAAGLYHRRQFFHRAFVRHYKSYDRDKNRSMLDWAVNSRMYITRLVMQQLNHTKEAAIAVALLVGEEVSIDEEINTAYAATGTLHVLSVSGMHVGLIFFLLSYLLKPLLSWKHGIHVYYPVVMILVWAYAFVAGAAPSITRAAMMCSFFLMAKWIDRKNQGFGALGASLFLILMMNPFSLFEPGMQLSFFAVLGIIWLQRPILRLWVPKNVLAFKAWELTSVSLAAQLTTLPVSLYYFGQFPNYFIVANLVVIPLTTACIYTLILQVCLTPVAIACHGLSIVNSWLLKLSNRIVMEIKDWPFAVSCWQVDLLAAVLLFVLVIEGEAWLRTKRFFILLRILCWLILFTLIRLYQTV